MSEQSDQRTASDNPLKEREIFLRERELTLKEKEVEAKAKLDARNLWFTSPLLIGVITAISGLLGTGIGAVLQGNANYKLERQKFEFTLIQEALKAPTQDKAVKQLLFLINSGVIISLDGDKIRNIAENEPSQLPVVVPNTATSRETFFKSYTNAFDTLLPKEGRAALQQIFDFIEKDKYIKDIRYVAYILATIQFETAGTYQPSVELNGEKQSYAPYYGRGYVQLTWEFNYKQMNEVLGLVNTDSDLVEHPEKALNPQIAYRILAYGMQNGTFTGRKLSDYITDDKTDYRNARRIINGLDRADQIAGAAEKFETILRDSLGSSRRNLGW